MEVKTEKIGIKNSQLKIYIDNQHWKTVRALYFERKIPKIIKSTDFKKKFNELERKKILHISLMLLSKRSYLKQEWFSKMKLKLFSPSLLEEVFEQHLKCYFDEDEEVMRRIEGYLRQGKGKRWILQKMSPFVSLSKSQFDSYLTQFCSTQDQIKQIQSIEQTRNLIQKKGRQKVIQFFLRRGFSYSDILTALSL